MEELRAVAGLLVVAVVFCLGYRIGWRGGYRSAWDEITDGLMTSAELVALRDRGRNGGP